MALPWLESHLDFRTVIRVNFIVPTILIILIRYTPALRSRLLAYGARLNAHPQHSGHNKPSPRKSNNVHASYMSVITALIESISKLTVPHSYFTSFYVFSIVSSIFWIQQIYHNGIFYRFVANHTSFSSRPTSNESISTGQVFVLLIMLLFQGCRRLYECVTLQSSSGSRMFIGHWVMGLLFYGNVGIASWLEGIPAIESLHVNESSHMNGIEVKTVLIGLSMLGLFVDASWRQHRCHVHLASLKKYSLPTDGLFENVICPHYGAEIMIYLSMWIISSPGMNGMNIEMLSALIFVAVNLGVTAEGTRNWYIKKFGSDSVKGKYKVLQSFWW